MKYILISLLTLSSLLANAQFPVSAIRKSTEYHERLEREGMPLFDDSTKTLKTGTWTAGQQGLVSFQVEPGSAWLIKRAVLSCNVAADLNFSERFGSNTDQMPVSTAIRPPSNPIYFSGKGSIELYAPNTILRQNKIIRIDAITANTDATARLKLYIQAVKISDDFDVEAEKVFLIIGDSIDSGAGVASGEQVWTSVVADSLSKATGKRWRVIRKAQFGINSSGMEQARRNRYLRIEKADLIGFKIGANDSGNPSNYAPNLAKWTAEKQVIYPKVPAIIFGPTPQQGSAETAMGTVRTAAQNQVTSLNSAGDATFYYINFGGQWNGTSQAATYMFDAVHPNSTGQLTMGNYTWSQIKANTVLYNLIR